jgi:hypothetical protein
MMMLAHAVLAEKMPSVIIIHTNETNLLDITILLQKKLTENVCVSFTQKCFNPTAIAAPENHSDTPVLRCGRDLRP